MAKKKAAPEPAGESAPMWIVSFADLVTLMMSFFVVLYALKQGGKETELSVTEAIVTQFNGDIPMDPENPLSVYHWGKKGIELRKDRGAADSPANGAEGTHPNVETIRETVQTPTSGGSMLFAFGQAELDAASRATIAKLIPVLQGHTAVLLVKGHVSSDEIANRPDDPHGLSLSTRRAMVVCDELIRLGIERRLLRPVACGPYEPLKSGAYEADELKKHRRVEVFSTDTFATDFYPIKTVPVDPATRPAPGKPEAATAASAPH